MEKETADECFFCNIFSKKNNGLQSLKWYDVPVLEESDFVAVPALGQIVPGYLLVAPRKHVFSIAQLNESSRKNFYGFIKQVCKLQTELWDRPIIFEHGACHESKKAGACINHAHWHLVPGNWNILPPDIQAKKLSSFGEFIEQTNKQHPYLLFVDQNTNFYLAEGDGIPSQFFRRFLAAAVGKPDEWDYLVFPFFENIKQTLAQILDKH